METHTSSASSQAIAQQRRLWQIIALVMLVAGWVGGGYLVQRGIVQERLEAARHADDDDNYDPMLSLEDSKKQSRELEMYMGKMGMLMYKIEGLMDAWGKPKPLGITIIILASVGAAMANAYGNLLQRRGVMAPAATAPGSA